MKRLGDKVLRKEMVTESEKLKKGSTAKNFKYILDFPLKMCMGISSLCKSGGHSSTVQASSL